MYSAPITRATPTAFILVVDQSGSMSERIVFLGAEMTKARAVSLAASGFVDELIHRARRESGVRDYYHIAVLGYGGAGVRMLLAEDFVKPSHLVTRDVRREKIISERILPSGRSVMAVVERNIWIEPRSEGATPMCAGFEQASRLLERWCARHPGSYGARAYGFRNA